MRGKSLVWASVMPVMWPSPMLIWSFDTVTEPRPAKSDELQPLSVLPSNNTPDSGIFPDDATGCVSFAAVGATACVGAGDAFEASADRRGQVHPASRTNVQRPIGR